MTGSRRKGSGPNRERGRSRPTVSEEPIKVAIATTPKSGSDGQPEMHQDVALVKAALLYADEVEIVSLGVSMFDELQQAMNSGDHGGFDLLAAMDDETLAHIASQGGNAELPVNWREMLGRALALDPNALERTDPGSAQVLRELREAAEEIGSSTQADIEALFEQFGATELVVALRAKVVKVADLGITPSTTLRPADVRATETDQQIWNWIDALISRLTDRRTRLLFDRDAGNLIQSMYDEGKIPASPQGMRLAAQAALGAGFAERLPAFPMAKMDELIDLRAELALPLARYRGAVIRFSKNIEPMVGEGLAFEVQQRWDESVKPMLMDLKDEMADHGLVRELARSLNVKDVRNFGFWTSGTYFAFANSTSLDALATGLVATGASAVPQAASVALSAVRTRRAATGDVESNELFYLYETNRRLER
ncbi:hypothetical protein [Aeromicrobium endophyticum]|nr:hypothetical protein [Aeromicrobium endophyticum]